MDSNISEQMIRRLELGFVLYHRLKDLDFQIYVGLKNVPTLEQLSVDLHNPNIKIGELSHRLVSVGIPPSILKWDIPIENIEDLVFNPCHERIN